jgi:hypothetical protein
MSTLPLISQVLLPQQRRQKKIRRISYSPSSDPVLLPQVNSELEDKCIEPYNHTSFNKHNIKCRFSLDDESIKGRECTMPTEP